MDSTQRINLDHISGNPLLPEVKKAMIAAIEADYGNPSSQHSLGCLLYTSPSPRDHG